MQPVTDLETICKLAQERHDEFEVMRYMLEADDDITDEEIDTFVEKLAAPVIEAIDCTKCANCCRSLDVYLTPNDARNLATGIDIPPKTIPVRYLEQEPTREIGEWGKFRQKPCVFLKDRLCTIYEHRPESCRMYPQLTPDFRWTLKDTIEGASFCPIIYNVLDVLMTKIDTLW